jgi:hypothetical protein
MVGGLVRWSKCWLLLSHWSRTVIRGDQHSTAPFDRRPEFVINRQGVLVVGRADSNHISISADLDAVMTAFRAGTAQLPGTGTAVVEEELSA